MDIEEGFDEEFNEDECPLEEKIKKVVYEALGSILLLGFLIYIFS